MYGREKMKSTPIQNKVLEALEDGVRTWDELQVLIKVSNDQLGMAIGELLNLRKIWTKQRGNTRVYGVEENNRLATGFTDDLWR